MIISCFIGVCVLLFGPLVSNACNVTLYAQREPLNFTSPNYPRNYTSNDNCYWDIYPQTRGYRVVLDMVFSDIEGSPGFTCRFDALTIYTRNNADQNQTDSLRICGQIRWNRITHANQHFHAVFKTDGSVTRGGFLIRYYETDGESNCGVPLVATPAGKTFTSPGYPNTYFLRQSCTWTITTEQQNQTILMYPTDSALQNASRRGICDSDYVTVYNVQNSSDILGTFCGNERPVFSSGGNSLRVRLQTDSSNNYKGFKMFYRAVPATTCRGTMPSGRNPIQIVSPGYPNNYQSGLDCQWTLNAPSGSNITVEVLFVDMEIVPSCTNDYLLFKDGTTNSARQLAKICERTSTAIVSSSNHMTIIFHSDSSDTGRGFRLQYSSVIAPICGLSDLYASSAAWTNLTSPGYPSNYSNNLNCLWTISAPAGYEIKVDVVYLIMQYSPACSKDYLLFSDGSTSYATRLGKYCGRGYNNREVVSSRNYMTITFHTDGSDTALGFRLNYKAGSFITTTTERPNVLHCGGPSLSASTFSWRYLSSPGYPYYDYNNGLDCQWTINAPSGSNITVEVLFVDMEIVPSCTNDYLLFEDGTTNSARQLAKICERTSSAIVSSSNHMTIIFHSDSSDTGRGFRLKYSTVIAPICGLSDLSASSAAWTYLTSPGYPSNYSNNLNCLWTISAPAGYKIKVDVVYLIMQYSPACSKDYLLFSDGSTSYATRLGKYCGSGYNNREVVSSRNYMTITFHTDGSDTALGFRLNYKAGSFITTTTERPNVLHCGGPSLSAFKFSWSYLSSPGYPQYNYNNNMDCTWTISASVGYKIRVEIQVLSVEYEATCAKDYLLFSDGSSSYDTQLGKYCSGTRDVVSSSNDMTITFHTDGSGTGRGFSLKYTARRKLACGTEERISRYDTKYIESPNYPLDYPDNSDCSWTISTDVDGYVIHVKEVYFYLEQDSPCSFDYVQLYDVRGTYEHSLGRWCGSDGPDTQSTGRSMKVRFLSDASSTFKGFKLAFTAGEPTSSSSFTSNVGAIMGGIFGGMVGVAIVTCCCCAICTRKKSTTNDQSQGNRSPEANLNIVYTVTLPNYPPTTATTQPDMFTPPPAYSEVVKDDPPPYCQAVPLSDIQPVVASSPSGASYQGIDNPAGPSRVTVSHDVHV